jgi:ribosome-associated translation inhibitor RaiA
LIDVEVHVPASIPPGQIEAARRRIASLDRFTKDPLLGARLTLRRDGGAQPPYVADVDVRYDGRVLAAHASGHTPDQAADEAAEALRRQVRRIVGAGVALRNDRRALAEAIRTYWPDHDERPPVRLKPPEEREIVARRTYADEPVPTLTAIADMVQDAEDFHLFVHARTGEDVVVHWLDAGHVGLLFPPGSALADEGDDLVVAQPSWFSEPLALATARQQMDVLNERSVTARFLYLIDAGDRRGKVIYLRLDGDYGLVEPTP